jgi:hypothetical protein
VTIEASWQKEWGVLRAERVLARRRWRSAADGLAARARDPLGLRRLVHDHPIAAGGIGAAAVALVLKLLFGGRKAPSDSAQGPGDAARPAIPWKTLLLDAATSIAGPWLLRLLKQMPGGDPEPGSPA